MRLTALVGDAHTMIYPTDAPNYDINIRWLKEGLFLLSSSDEWKDHLGKKLTAVDGKPIQQVTDKLKTVISHENEQWFKTQAADLLRNSQVLYGLSIAEKPGEIVLSLEDANGEISQVRVKGTPVDQRDKLQYSFMKSMTGQYPMNYVNNGRYYWHLYMEDQQALYIQYNMCSDSPGQSVEQFIDEIKQTVKNHPIDKVMVDLRNNRGGNSLLIRSLLSAIVLEEFNQPERLFVFIGKNTFSSGMKNAMEFRKWTKATLVGEPTGGKPRAYGDVQPFQLPHTGLQGQYSTKYFNNAEDDDTPSLMPDILVEPSIEELQEGRDFCLEYALRTERQ
ncbi:MAG: peptidase [Paenibacillaceae bacterium]|jgi:C-terminal processing protease CtpA/Prc|nr:peptidase [Paenibacillaceae bacterium]